MLWGGRGWQTPINKPLTLPISWHRYAKYYKEDGTDKRTLYKVFGIRFDILVNGKVRAAGHGCQQHHNAAPGFMGPLYGPHLSDAVQPLVLSQNKLTLGVWEDHRRLKPFTDISRMLVFIFYLFIYFPLSFFPLGKKAFLVVLPLAIFKGYAFFFFFF